jgi:hypothetical protein
MKNPKGSKSACTLKAPKAPEQCAPASPKTGRKKKSAPTPRVDATPAEVPEWAKRAAARDTAAEMAAVPAREADAPSESSGDLGVQGPTGATPASKKGRPSKPKAAPKAAVPDATPAKPGSLRAIGSAWIEALRANGHSVSTVSSYTNDLELAYEFLGGDGPAKDLTERQIAGFNSCNLVTKKRSGKAKAKPTILKTRRALRLALVCAEQKGLLKRAPYPSKTTC